MKRINIILVIASILAVIACVDDYQDANPPRPKDGPFFKVSLSDDVLVGGESFTFTIDVIDAPGGIDSVAISNPQRLGSFTIDNLSEVRGDDSGVITGTFVTPTTYQGDLELTFEVFDSQVDEKGEDARKSASVSEVITISFPEGATDFSVIVPSETFTRGDSFDFTIEITDAPGGVDSIFTSVDAGTIEIDPASYAAVIGSESGTVTATYTSDAEYVGDVVLTVSVIDMLQQRVSAEIVELTAEYEFDAPAVSLTIDATEFKAFNEVGLEVAITAPGTIDTILIESFEVTSSSGNGDEVGEPSLDESDLEDAVGVTSGTVGGSFISEVKGFINIKVTVIDEQGRSTADSVEVLVLPCDKADLAGEYRSVASGNSAFAPVGPYTDLVDTVEISGGVGNIFDVSDLSFGLWEVQGFGPEAGSIVTCDDNIVSGSADEPFIMVTSGTINGDGTIELEWESPDGDTGSVVLTPIP